MLSDQIIEKILASLPALRIGVLGDLFLDRYLDIDGNLTEPSLETGLDAYQVVRVRPIQERRERSSTIWLRWASARYIRLPSSETMARDMSCARPWRDCRRWTVPCCSRTQIGVRPPIPSRCLPKIPPVRVS